MVSNRLVVKKRIIFHIGTHKTGTSALQTWFGKNQQALLAAGVDYPYPDPPTNVLTGNCCGNFLRAIQTFTPELKHETSASKICSHGLTISLDRIVDRCLSSNQETILFSGETLSVLSKNSIDELHRAFAPFFDITVVCVIRDLFDYSFSLWKQLVKMLSTDESFRAWLSTNLDDADGDRHSDSRYLFNLRLALTAYLDKFDDVRFINYDFHRNDLTTQFFETVGLNLTTGISMEVERLCNPSLSDSQAFILQMINARFGRTDLPHSISNTFSAVEKQSAELKFYDPDMHQEILDFFSTLLTKINTGLPIQEPLGIAPRSQNLMAPVIALNDINYLLLQLSRATEKRGFSKYLASVIALLNKALPIPFDFNAETYLQLNQDLSQANVNPFVHYIRHGKREGRAYKML